MREKEKKVVRDEYIEGTHNHARVCLVHLCLPPPQKKMRNPSNGMCVCVSLSFRWLSFVRKKVTHAQVCEQRRSSRIQRGKNEK